MNRQFDPRDPEFKSRVIRSFDAQAVMQTLNASLALIEPGEVRIEFPYQPSLTQQDGFIHAGISSTVMDSACGYAAFTLMPAEARVLTIEFKINLLAPAAGENFLAHGRVRKPGRSVFVAEAELYAQRGDEEKLVATMVGTLMAIYPQSADAET
ncbi:MAG TPA: PaaI family thioesterase [Gammaproteobacteria bacterium]|nr:PaaI family thioesterase [Gammaproteobacteria bacterium]